MSFAGDFGPDFGPDFTPATVAGQIGAVQIPAAAPSRTVTYFPFLPNPRGPFIFQPTLFDTTGTTSATYVASVPWSLFGGRYYLLVSTQSGSVIFNRALVDSPGAANLQSLTWDNGIVTAFTAAPHGYVIGATVPLNIMGCAPNALNGEYDAFVIDPQTFQYQVQADPGATTRLGNANYLIDMASGYFSSSIIFRNNTFEVWS